SMAGTLHPDIEVVPLNAQGAVQAEITDNTTTVRVRVSIPLSDNALTLSSLFVGRTVFREAEVSTERSTRSEGAISQ
ncbi:MAG: hypothetical protein ACK5Q5_06455, partial [Planctomycetaceae bacterium]